MVSAAAPPAGAAPVHKGLAGTVPEPWAAFAGAKKREATPWPPLKEDSLLIGV